MYTTYNNHNYSSLQILQELAKGVGWTQSENSVTIFC